MESSTTSVEESLFLSYDEAVKVLPESLLGDDEKEKQDVAMFLKHVNRLHKPVDVLNNNYFNAKSISSYVVQLFVDYRKIVDCIEIVDEHPNHAEDFGDQLFHITSDIATKVAGDIINKTNLHKITLNVLTFLQQYSWEIMATLSIATYILTFGDSGLCICPKSKLYFNNSPYFVRHLLWILRDLVGFEKLPTTYMTSMDHDIKIQRTHFIIAVYWTIRCIVAKTTSHIMTIPGIEFDTADKTTSSTALDYKLWHIRYHHLELTLQKFKSLLGVDDKDENYKRTKQAFHEKNHLGNMNVLNALFFPVYDDYNQLVLANSREVHVRELKGKIVLFLISDFDINAHEIDTIKDIYIESKNKFDFEMVWIPIVDLNTYYRKRSMYEKLISSLPWYCLIYPLRIYDCVKRILKDDWKFKDEPIIVMLDPQGKVVNQNAIDMMLIWHYNSVPFTSTREETLWEQETWRLELLANGIDQQILDWIHNEKYIFMYGGGDIDWIRSFTSIVREIANELAVPIEMVYVGSNKSELQESVINIIKNEKLSHCLSYHALWYFKKRKDTMLHSLMKHEKFDNIIFQEILRLDNHIKSDVEWAIFAKGSRILVNGHGELVLSTLKNFRLWKEKALQVQLGLGMEFKRSYQELYLEKFPLQRMEFLSNNVKVPTTIPCSICHDQMQHYNIFICSHPSIKNQSSSESVNYPSGSDHFSLQPNKDSSIKDTSPSHIIYYPSSYPRLA